MKELTATGTTVDDAINQALQELEVRKEDVDVRIIDEGKRGFLGIFGARPAIVRVTVKIDPVEETKKYLTKVCKEMGIDIKIDTSIEGRYVYYTLTSNQAGLLIGKRGQTLNALQTLSQLVINKYSDKHRIVRLDTENYRKKREESLIRLANRIANRVAREQKKYSLEPMPSFERKIIHNALAGHNKVTTYSEGSEPNRYIVISPK